MSAAMDHGSIVSFRVMKVESRNKKIFVHLMNVGLELQAVSWLTGNTAAMSYKKKGHHGFKYKLSTVSERTGSNVFLRSLFSSFFFFYLFEL